jgi:WD40 repeat protein
VPVSAKAAAEQDQAGGCLNFLQPTTCRTGEASFMDTADAHTGAVRSLAVSPDGRMLLSGSDDKTCKLWDLSTKKCLATW